MTLEGHDIICLSTSDWEYPIGSKQQVMRRLAEANRILYVEYQASWLHPLRYPSLRSRWSQGGQMRQLSEGLWTYTPKPSIPFGTYSRTINALNQKRLERELHALAGRLDFKRPILWFYTPLSSPLIGRMDESLVVYHCIAEFPEEKASRFRRQTLAVLEADLAQKTDVAFAIASPLMDKLSPWVDHLHYLPSGVDWDRFSDPSVCSAPPEVEALPQPRIGIVGMINYTADISLIETMATSRPEWTFLHVGTVVLPRGQLERLKALPNWVSFGRQPYEDIPGFIAGMDVCLLPLVDTLFTRSMSSLRLMEYLAMGRPVVATDLPDVKAMGDVVVCVRGPEEFISAIEEALKPEEPAAAEARRRVACAHSWDVQVETVSNAIEELLGKPGSARRVGPSSPPA